ncbi:MAG: hypothetical protein ACYDHW_17030 [Syntrophorhabdaceae bacterium]
MLRENNKTFFFSLTKQRIYIPGTAVCAMIVVMKTRQEQVLVELLEALNERNGNVIREWPVSFCICRMLLP